MDDLTKRREEAWMGATVPCRVRRGLFSNEWLVAVMPRGGKEVSFFVDRSFVQPRQEPEGDEEVEGLLRVAVVKQENGSTLVQLPTVESETGRVWVAQDRLQEVG